MNRHVRLLVAALFAILMILITAIVVFYVDVNKDSQSSGAGVSAAAESSGTEGKVQIFQDENGLYGLTDGNGNVILDAEWTELTEVGTRCFQAKLRTRAQTLTGVIDSEGNIIVPFAYQQIQRLTDFLYAGQLASDGTFFFYDGNFQLLLPEAWDEYSVVDQTLRLKKDGDQFVYGLAAELELIEISLPRRKRPVSFDFQVKDPQILSMMDRSDWSGIGDVLITYLDSYRRDKLSELESITHQDQLSQVTAATETEFTWRGSVFDSISVSAEETEGVTMLQCQMELQVLDEEEISSSVQLTLSFAPDETGNWLLYNAEFS